MSGSLPGRTHTAPSALSSYKSHASKGLAITLGGSRVVIKSFGTMKGISMPKFDGAVAVIKLQDIQEELKEGVKKVVLIDEKGTKFRFKDKKQDGTQTKAFEVYKNMDLKAGDMIEVGYKTIEGKFTGDDGKDVNYKSNYVSFLKKADEMNPNGTFKPGEGSLGEII